MSRRIGLLQTGSGNALTLLANGAWSPLVTARYSYTRDTTTTQPDADFEPAAEYTSGTVEIDTAYDRIAPTVYRWNQQMVALTLDGSLDLSDYTTINFEFAYGSRFVVDICTAASVEDAINNLFEQGAASVEIDGIRASGGNVIRLCSEKRNSSTEAVITKIWLN